MLLRIFSRSRVGELALEVREDWTDGVDAGPRRLDRSCSSLLLPDFRSLGFEPRASAISSSTSRQVRSSSFRSLHLTELFAKPLGLLLDLDDLLPTTSAESIKTDLPSYDEKTPAFRPLPANPHALVDISSPTFPLATSLYRSLLVDLATNHDRRRAMGQAAAIDASSRSWHGAMEMLVDGYREIARPAPPPPSLGLSRTSTIEFDIVSHLAESDTYAESTAAAPKGRRGVGRVLRLGGVFKRTGGRLKEGSMSVPGNFLWRRGGDAKPVRSWLGRKEGMSVGETVEGVQLAVQSNQVWATSEFLFLARFRPGTDFACAQSG